MFITQPNPSNKQVERRKELKNTLVKSRKNILLQWPRDGLQSLMRFTVIIVVFHIFHRGERRLNTDRVALVSGVGEGLPDGSVEDVGFSVLRVLG